MSEKRFKKMDTIIDPFPIWDTVEEKGYNCIDTLDLLVDLLNNLIEENEQLRQSYKYADELIEEIREIFQKNGVESGYNKVILESLFFSTRENEQLRKKNAQLNERLRECYVRLDRNNCPKW